MKRDSPIYVRYLESLVLSLLTERQSDLDISGLDFNGDPVTYSPYNAKQLIEQTSATSPTLRNAERVDFKMLQMPCCGHLLCWVNPRYPSYCPECGKIIYPEIKNPKYLHVRQEDAILKW